MRTAETASVDESLDVEALQALLQEHPVQLAILFGSHATGTTHSTSDIDIAVEFDAQDSSDSNYNEMFFGLSADLSDTLSTDDVDLVDLHTVSPAVAKSIFDNGILLVGEQKHATDLQEKITAADAETQSPRERLDAALARIDTHLDGNDAGVPASGRRKDDE